MPEFSLPPERMRQLGYLVVDRLVDHWLQLPELPAMRVSGREELERRLREPLPRDGAPFEEVIESVLESVFTSVGHINHPRFFGFIPTPSNFVSVLADLLGIGYNPFCGTWLEGSGPAMVEMVTIDWLRQILGMPEGGGGLFVSGGSIANLTALIAARESKPGSDRRLHRIYGSDQTHSSVDRALKIIGYGDEQFRRLSSGEQFRLEMWTLQEAVSADRSMGLVPLAVIANAGATNTGAVDPLTAIADLCEREGIWLHVDGAYGAAAAFSRRGRELLAGIGRADSVTLDPHKWLFQPYPMGCVLMRDVELLGEVFHVLPEYLRDTATERGEVNFCDYGPELTRPFRALKLWVSIKVFGADAFERAVDHGFALSETLERMLGSDSCWEILTPANMAIVCFRYRAPELGQDGEDALQAEIARRSAAEGFLFLSTTALRGRTVLRMCTIQPATTEHDLRRSVECLRGYGIRLTKEYGTPHATIPGSEPGA